MSYYIKECDKENILKKVLCMVKSEKHTIELPVNSYDFYNKKNRKISKIYKNNLIKKLKKISNEELIVLSKNIMQNKEFLEDLEKNDMIICDGNWLYRYILEEIIEYILKEKKQIKQNTEITFLVNFFNDSVVENIKRFAREYKRINIVTNHIEKLRNIEKDLYEQDGIIITISNNKRKSLARSKIIINLDFPNELINKYNIYDNAIIVSIEEKIKIKKMRFLGIVVNDYEIKIKNEDKYQNYAKKSVLESKIYRKDNFENIKKDIKENETKIKELYGNNGKLNFN